MRFCLGFAFLSFGAALAVAAAQAGAAEPDSSLYDGRPRDAIDAAAPHDADAARRLEQAAKLMERGRWQQAQEFLQYIIDRSANSLVRLSDGRLVSVADETNRLLGQFPADALELYRRKYGPAARKALEEAATSGLTDRMHYVATQFRHTVAGGDAVRRLARIHFDRGEFGLAARHYLDLGDDLDAASRVRAIYALAATGDREAAESLLTALNDDQRAAIVAALPPGTDARQLIAEASARAWNARRVTDWASPLGNAAGSAYVRSGEPVLLRRWYHPLTYRGELQERIDQTTSDLRDAGQAPILAAVPLAIGDRVIARSLRGVSVYSARDGRLLWETGGDASIERRLLIEDDVATERAVRIRVQGFGVDPRATRETPSLTPFLFRDGVRGFLTADSERLYVVENTSPGSGSWPPLAGRNASAAFEDGSSNRIVAYDLASGRPAWLQFGGLGGLTDGPFVPPMAGHFFFGPPTPVGETLYSIAETEKEIRLIAIEATSGTPKWHLVIADAPVDIEQDSTRRLGPATVAASDGVLVCPTTVGWLVGVDATRRSILWAYRYTPPQSDRDAEMLRIGMRPPRKDGWGPSAPVIHGGRVLYTPAEESNLVCLDVHSGELQWQRQKGTYLYVAGVNREIAIVVSSQGVEGIDIPTGKTRWSMTLPKGAAPPSGRAALTEDRLYVPLGGESLWEIDPRDGSHIGFTQLAAGERMLGNLVLHRGTLVSLGPGGLTAFEERTGLVKSIDERLASDPTDPDALLRRAELQRADGQIIAADETLDSIAASELQGELADRFRALRWRVLITRMDLDRTSAESALESLDELARTSDEQFLVRRLRADKLAAGGRTVEAAEAYLKLLFDENASRYFPEDEGQRLVRLDAMIAGRLEDLWESAGEGDRAELDTTFRRAIEAASSPEQQDQLARAFAFHPASVSTVHELAKSDLERGRLAEAELRLLSLTRRNDPDVASQAFHALAAAAECFRLESDARYWSERAAALAGDGSRRESEGIAEPGATARHWGEFRLSVVRPGGNANAEQAIDMSPTRSELPFFHERTFRLLAQQGRLLVSGPAGAGLMSTIPLRAGTRGARYAATADGHVMFITHRGVLNAVSPIERRTLWSLKIEDEPERSFARETAPATMRTGNGLPGAAGLVTRSRQSEPTPVANASYAALRSRRGITVVDSRTGEILWSRSDVPRQADVVGTERYLYVISRSRETRSLVLRASDGKVLEQQGAFAMVPRAVASVGDRLLTVISEEPFRLFDLRIGGRAVVTLYDPTNGNTVWAHSYPPDALFEVLPDGSLCVLRPDTGELAMLDPVTGRATPLGSVPTEVLQRRSDVVLLSDPQSVFVLVNVGRAAVSYNGAELPAIVANGEIFAFDKGTGELLWRRSVSGQRLLYGDFNQMPVLLLTDSDQSPKGGRSLWRIDLLALDKRSGKTVLDEPVHMTMSPFFRSLDLHPDRRSIELTSHSFRIRLQAIPNNTEPTRVPVVAPTGK